MSAFVFAWETYLNASKAKYVVEVCFEEQQNLVGVNDKAASYYPLLSNQFCLSHHHLQLLTMKASSFKKDNDRAFMREKLRLL